LLPLYLYTFIPITHIPISLYPYIPIYLYSSPSLLHLQVARRFENAVGRHILRGFQSLAVDHIPLKSYGDEFFCENPFVFRFPEEFFRVELFAFFNVDYFYVANAPPQFFGFVEGCLIGPQGGFELSEFIVELQVKAFGKFLISILPFEQLVGKHLDLDLSIFCVKVLNIFGLTNGSVIDQDLLRA